MDKTVGVLGGLGPHATVAFMQHVLALTPIITERDHLRLLVDCNPRVPDINAAALGTGPSAAPDLVRNARALVAAGAEFVVLVCNAAHIYSDTLAAEIDVPFISMIDATVEAALAAARAGAEAGEATIGLVATDGGLRTGLYQDSLARRGARAICHTPEELAEFMAAIQDIKRGAIGPESKTGLLRSVSALSARGARAVILGCTEAALIDLSDVTPVPLVDPVRVLAEATVAYATSGIARAVNA